MILYINSADKDSVKVSLKAQNGRLWKKSAKRSLSSQALLGVIEKLLKDAGIKITDLTKIEFFRGPGSYTGLKVGATVANTLGWLLKIPVNGQKNKIVLPDYE
ncbi:hypothetical protein A3J20_05870 [Candidatus Gottesmanbacteria bacterium RIFCSPLOWO2_02_FULL_42_29]|uniref:Gcp-like domain-containing protein n=2 Tax=Candidatus Gottesmaniibacteriota TaxID=1752720 RepID=A0A1F6BGP1_9BACT|nr:MAG: Glycoprotease [Candidatus Gottesmanbacteria bacterium GW2011_GWA2_42_18]KKS75776.1 MAG: Glycoprotease [Candidatus Gottesmanbacteria bacterium GW2011_GWC2_42_8]OGG11038.1 MAG: hypothetical protein A2781_04190 [Candidatus Gottesmanbacteria bacterium RIFCSPHIGHO2_01_FULL_42_27]OGG19141.1 MAG: hypothetical protein A3E72_02905 [Candidatus Gottesmanbacteria bacterium RIFCSPHIGHO2_12_FULL_43_26]OGG35983.1 MAG: hypothetical protein A2968_03690 [Candidatus Gottesmanbacteria bacterium RIFCSPLOWO2